VIALVACIVLGADSRAPEVELQRSLAGAEARLGVLEQLEACPACPRCKACPPQEPAAPCPAIKARQVFIGPDYVPQPKPLPPVIEERVFWPAVVFGTFGGVIFGVVVGVLAS
jgi:hypothetical protein